jgi:hypothetical protein
MKKREGLHGAEAGFSLVELMMGLLGAGLFAFFIATQAGSQAKQQSAAGAAAESLSNLALPIAILKKDLARSTSVALNGGLASSIRITMDAFDPGSGSIQAGRTVDYSISSVACPEFGATAQCKTLTRAESGGATLSFTGLAGVDWCLSGAGTGNAAFDDCSNLPFVAALPGPATSLKRFALSFRRFAGPGLGLVPVIETIVDLENVSFSGAAKSTRFIR